MTPAARSQAAIDLLDTIIAAAREGGAAADTLAGRFFSARRYAGSKDRRAVRELVYAAIRFAGEPPLNGRAALVALARSDDDLAATFDGSAYGPAPITPEEPAAQPGVAPAWLLEQLAASGIAASDLPALVERAPLDVRVNTLRTSRDAVMEQIGAGEAIPGLADALRLPSGFNVEPLAGLAEVQDAGSQIVALAAGTAPGMAVVDLCAGAGGKTLALAAAMRNDGRILACDTDRGRLSRLAPRAERAGVTIAETRLLDPQREAEALSDWRDTADVVLVDSPCSGTGTWRRNPEARWRLTPERLDRLIATQAHVLDVAAPLVRPGGSLVFIVCSLLDGEGAGQATRFLGEHPGWTADPLALSAGRQHGAGVRLQPGNDSTDGFFVARLRAPC